MTVGIPGVDRPDIALSAYRGRRIERDDRYRQDRDTDRDRDRELGALTINDLIKMQDKEVLGEKSPSSSVLIYDPKGIWNVLQYTSHTES